MTDFVDGIILILKDEVVAGRLTQSEYEDYIELIDMSANRVFKRYTDFRKQVITMTKSLITLPSERYEIYERQLAEKDYQINQITVEKDNVIAEKDNALAEKDSALAEKDSALAKKDAQIQALLKQLEKINNK